MKKCVVMILCLILALLVSVSAVACNNRNNNENYDFCAVDENGNGLVSGKVYDMPKNITFLSETEENITLSATIEPVYATNKKVDWFVEWVDNGCEFAIDKIVSDYVTVNPVYDGALIAEVSCLQAFGCQIRIKVVSRDNSSISASCLVDFTQKLNYIEFSMSQTTLDGDDVWRASKFSQFNINFSFWFDDCTDDNIKVFDIIYGDYHHAEYDIDVSSLPYTIADIYETTVTLKVNPAFVDLATYIAGPNLPIISDPISIDVTNGFIPGLDTFVSLFGTDIVSDDVLMDEFLFLASRVRFSSLNPGPAYCSYYTRYDIGIEDDNYQEFYNLIASCHSVFILDVVSIGQYSSYTKTVFPCINATIGDYSVDVQSLDVNNVNLEF